MGGIGRRSLIVLPFAALRAQDPVFRATVPVVVAPVTVTDPKDRFVDGLGAADFVLFDNGRRVETSLDVIEAGAIPLSLVILVQANDIAAHSLMKIVKVGPMIQPLITGERGAAAVVSYSHRIDIVQPFTRDADEIKRAMAKLQPSGSRTARMLDAIVQACEMLRQRPREQRKVVLIFGESRDRGSDSKLPAVLEQLQRDNTQVYAATYSVTKSQFTTRATDRPPPGKRETDLGAAITEIARLGTKNDAEEITNTSGGRKLAFSTLGGLEKVITRAGEEMHAQYLLTFPASGPEGLHRIEVKLRNPDKNRVSARQAYWAVSV